MKIGEKVLVFDRDGYPIVRKVRAVGTMTIDETTKIPVIFLEGEFEGYREEHEVWTKKQIDSLFGDE